MTLKDRKILIVEDEQIIAENLRFILQEYGYTFIDVAIDAAEAQNLFEKTRYDLVLMDINLGEYSAMNGIDLIKNLSQKYSFLFMYVTANADIVTVENAKSTKPAGYIIKPFINASIFVNVEMILNTLKEEVFFTHVDRGMQQKIPISTINYVKAEGAYIYIHTLNNSKYLARKSLVEFGKMFPNSFIRIHKSILINKECIQAYTSQMVKVNNIQLPLGRAYKQVFLEQIKGLSFS